MTDKKGQGADAQVVEVTAADERQVELMSARRFMQFALAGEVLFWVLLFTAGAGSALAPLAMAAFVGAWVAAVKGVSHGARAVDMGPGMRIGFYVLAFGMLFRLVPIAYFLGRSKAAAGPSADEQQRQRVVDEARQWARERQLSRQPVAAPASAPAASAVRAAFASPPAQAAATPPAVNPVVRERLSRVLPRIRIVRNGLQEGECLRMPVELPPGFKLPPGMTLDQMGQPITRATQGIFGVNYMVDEGERYTSVGEDDLVASGFSLDELHQIALRNLRQLVTKGDPGLKIRRLPAQGGPSEAIMITLDGNNEASLLLIDELWDKSLAKHIPNGVVAVVPARDVCVFIDMNSVTKGGMGDLQSVVAGVHQRQGHSFPGLLHRQAGRWVLAGEVQGLAPA